MRRKRRTTRSLLVGLFVLSWGSSCQSTPAPERLISAESSLLAVDVVFPARLSRDRSLVQAFFARDGEPDELPEFVPATFVKWSRAYLLDPEPGTYSLVAVTSAVAPPWNEYPVAGGVTHTRNRGTIAHAVIFPAELVHRTRTTIARGDVAFMGALRIKRGDPVDADVAFEDDLQRRIAERIRPGATSETGLARWFPRTWLVDLAQTSISRDAADRNAFFENAFEDLGESPWAHVVARAAPHEARIVSKKPASRNAAPRVPEPEIATRKPPVPSADLLDRAEPLPPSAPAEEISAVVKPRADEAPQSTTSIPRPEVTASRQSPAPIPHAGTAESVSNTPMPENTRANPDTTARTPRSTPTAPQTVATSQADAATQPTVAETPAPPLPESQTSTVPQDDRVGPRPASLVPTVGPQSEPALLASAVSAPITPPRRFSKLPPGSPLAQITFGMSHHEVRSMLGEPDDRIDRITVRAWIPFYSGAGGYLRDWIYEGKGRVVFSLHKGSLDVVDVIDGSDTDSNSDR